MTTVDTFKTYPARLQYTRDWRAKNREKCAEASRRWREKNPVTNKEMQARLRKENPKKQTYDRATARASRMGLIPQDADRSAIRAFYDACPAGYEVDHIKPLNKGGLHEISNLQYLTRSENRAKGNRWEEAQ